MRKEAERVAGADGSRRGERLRLLAAAGMLEKPAACVHCRGAVLKPWGKTGGGVPRLRCSGCRRTVTVLTGTVLERIRRPDRLIRKLGDVLSAEPNSRRVLARGSGSTG